MVMEDFVYAGETLRDMNYMIAYMSSGNDAISNGSVMTQTTVKNGETSQNNFISVSYDEPITAQFSIFKNNCYDSEHVSFDRNEVSFVMRWLGQKIPQKFVPVYDDTTFNGIYYIGTFTSIESIYIGEEIIGFNLTFTSDSPWGYQEYVFDLEDETTEFKIYDYSDEIGKTLPIIFRIELCEDGDIECAINNKNNFAIKNCLEGDVYEFDCRNKVLTQIDGTPHTALYNDFNFNYPYIENEFRKRENVISTNKTIKLYVKYLSVRKVGIMV